MDDKCVLRGERAKHEEEYEGNGEGCFVYEVQHPRSGQWMSLDATRAFGTIGRLINHGAKESNLRAMSALVDGVLEGGIFGLQEHTSW